MGCRARADRVTEDTSYRDTPYLGGVWCIHSATRAELQVLLGTGGSLNKRGGTGDQEGGLKHASELVWAFA